MEACTWVDGLEVPDDVGAVVVVVGVVGGLNKVLAVGLEVQDSHRGLTLAL